MAISKKLSTFVLVFKDGTTSPVLTTTREYGRWLESNFDEYTCIQELYMSSRKNVKAERVLESHPGTNIGIYFKQNKFFDSNLQSWYIQYPSNIITKLKQYKLAELRDCVPISANDELHRKLLRVYTVEQIELYIREKVDKDFLIQGCIQTPKQIRVGFADKDIIRPTQTKRKKLF